MLGSLEGGATMMLSTKIVVAVSLICASGAFGQQRLMTPGELQAISSQPADATSRYGSDPSQFGELRLPAGPGPHPLVVLIHGGCFKAEYATLRDLAPIGDALKSQGIATWNIEYRRLGEPGGGWPGTYLDVGHAIDHLRTLAKRNRLDLRRVVLVGHSAGGHLALWGASRGRVPAGSAIAQRRPLRPIGAIDLAGPMDMRENIANYEEGCRDRVVTRMLGGTSDEVADRYRAASAGALLPLGVPHVLIWGEHENFVPRPLAEAYVARARSSGDDAKLRVVPGAGHFEIASPHSSAWPAVLAEIQHLLRPS